MLCRAVTSVNAGLFVFGLRKMREIPECLSRRYKALDDLIQELSSYQPTNPEAESSSTDDPGIKLMCDFWGILKEDPDVNLTQAVQQRLRANGVTSNSGIFGSRHVCCYRSGCCSGNEDKKQEALKKIKKLGNENSDNTSQCGSSKKASSQNLPLNKVLCNLKEAASFEKKCQSKVSQLQESQKDLQEQIEVLEEREKEGVKLLKQADCMWNCMEEAYKKKIAESLERQKGLLKQLKEAEESNKKWRKNKKDLEFQMDNINKCSQEISEKIHEKTSDIKCINMEIDTFKKRIASNKTDLEATKKTFGSKKQASDAKMSSIAEEVTKLEKIIAEEKKHKLAKEQEGTKYIKEAREELQKLCKVMLQKQLENEDLQAEKEALMIEIDLLIQNCDQCKEKCKNKEKSMDDEIKALDKEIADFKVRCIQCHECVDTVDIRKFCTDCPKCLEERNCLDKGDHCDHDHANDCVCMTVKQKFLDNVFDNMYTSLERQVKTAPGKAVADEVVNCLKRSRNGKLNEGTRKILQDFILTTVKKNLTLTIVGGAVKTRCEMDADTYKQLMVCLKKVKIEKPQKTDKGTSAKKDPCKRWGGTSECNCPKGSKECICTKALPPPGDPSTCPPPTSDKDDAGEVVACPHKDSTACGPDCGKRGMPDAVGSEVAAWRPSPCQGPTCSFKNVRAAQCVLGPEILTPATNPMAPSSFSPTTSILEDQVACRCGGVAKILCDCHKDSKKIKDRNVKSCDKDTCTQKVAFNKSKENTEKSNIDFSLAQETHSIIDKKELKITDSSPVVTRTSLGDLKVALDHEIVKLIDKKLQNNPNLFIELNQSNSGDISVDLPCGSKKVLAKKSPSGNIILEIDNKVGKKCTSTKKTKSKCLDQSCGSDIIVSHKNLTKFILDTTSKKVSSCKKKAKKNNKLFKVRVKSDNKIGNELLFALKQTDSSVYELILDKEFEKWYLQTVKDNHMEENNKYNRLTRTKSGHFILKFDVKDDSESKNALLIRSHSGNNIKLVVSNNESQIEFIEKKFGSVLCPRTLSYLFNQLPNSNREVQCKNIKKSQTIDGKFSSDSNLYRRAKFDIKNNQKLNESKELIKKTNSGQYTFTLNKESKTAFIETLEKNISGSTKLLKPIKQTGTENVAIGLNGEPTSRYTFLTHTQSENMHAILSENTTNEISTNTYTLPKDIDKITIMSHNYDKTSATTATNCKGKCEDNLCDASKCVCHSSYNSKEFIIGNAEMFFKTKGFLSSDAFINEHSKNRSNSTDQLIRDLTHIVIKPCGCRSMFKKPSLDNQPNCPYHYDRYHELSNEILEISSLYQENVNNIENEKYFVKNRNLTHFNKNIVSWDTLQYLPPQLPPFLKDYSFL